MANKKALAGVVLGVAAVSVAVILLSRNKKLRWKSINKSAKNILRGFRSNEDSSDVNDKDIDLSPAHDGRHLANKARQRAMQQFGQSN